MSGIVKKIIVFVAFLVIVIVLIMALQFMAYKNYEAHLKDKVGTLTVSLSKEEVLKFMGQPDDSAINATGETLYWSSKNHQGSIYDLFGLSTAKGHYGVAVTFDSQDRPLVISEGTN